MDWIEFTVDADGEAVDSIAEVFQRYGGRGVVVEDHDPTGGEGRLSVKTYLPVDGSLPQKKSWIDLAVRLLALVRPLGDLEERVITEDDWTRAWRKHYKVLHIGERLVICPTWLGYSLKPGDAVIRVDPGMAFGTGLHPTTRMCLELLERFVRPGMRVLDLGTGTGILSIAAIRLGAAGALALDIDPVAVRVARENLLINEAKSLIEVREGTIGAEGLELRAPYDLIVANIAAKPIVDMAPAMLDHLGPKGIVIAGGFLEEQLTEVEERFRGLGAPAREVVATDDWRTAVFTRLAP